MFRQIRQVLPAEDTNFALCIPGLADLILQRSVVIHEAHHCKAGLVTANLPGADKNLQ